MSYEVFARKYRPQTFDDLVGQAHVSRTLKNAVAQNRLAHAYLFVGPRGIGKTSTARILAKALNCVKGPTVTPDNTCDNCKEIAAGNSLDVLEIDGASNNGVEQVRELRENARYTPSKSRFKIYIIDEVHMLSNAAFNALLKTLEEPPPRVKFIFATTEYHKIPETILSRCQQYDFRMIPARELQAHLRTIADAEKIRVQDASLALIARAAEGSVRDALSLFDQVLAFTGQEVKDEEVAGLLGLVDRQLLHRATRALVASDSVAMLELVESLADYGADYRNFVRELLLYLREVLVVKLAKAEGPLLASILPEEIGTLRETAALLSEEDLLRSLDLLTRLEAELRLTSDPRVTLDLALLKLVQMRRLLPFAELVSRVERLAGGSAPAPTRREAARPQPAPAAAAPTSAPPRSPAVPSAPVPGDEAGAILAEMRRQAPFTLTGPLLSATARLEGDALVLEVAPDFVGMATLHADDYRALARRAAGRPLALRLSAGGTLGAEEPPAPSPAEERRQKLREDAEREPAVKEALDLFGARLMDVREAKPDREDP
ncbi:MAG TPA: DNA polymerase III subunit gamma/tau [Vicinamibacteria bacterium]|nr:DNA polymerase III subunit gamma/tau [Vicinamibacteria bacterium]